ncbi:MAG: heavy metal translocating P-type ATPase [Lachnospiraceae bacterium]|nr:heavy metal translocating P-type ATPase [Lachnospiraceae bacterium]
MNSLPEVNNVVLTFATGQLLVDADDLDKALEVLRELAEKEEPGTIIEDLKRPGSIGNNTADVAHIHKHTDGHNHTHHHHHHGHEHHHHHHDGEHQHNHGECTCGCCESEEHVQNHNKKTSLLSAFLDEKKELASIGAGIVFFAAGIAAEHFTNSAIMYISLFIISYIILGGEVLATAVKNLFRGKVFDENFLMGIATIGAFVIGEYPEAAGVMLFYRIGELFEDVAVGRSRKQIMDAVDMRPETVRLMVGGKPVNSNPANVKPGDIIEVRPGDRIPLDGVVTEGESRIDTSAVTGEPVPVSISEGSHVLSGCVNVSGVIYLKVEKILEESMVSRILEAVENAAASKPHIDRFITKFASIYTPIVVLAAVLTAVVPSLVTGNWSYWVYTALTFLVISCPCALVLSVPLAFFAGIGAGSKKGILFKGGVSLETLAGIKAVVMDKTGTVTKGNFSVAAIVPEKTNGLTEEKLLGYAGCAEKLSTHPIATSIMKEAESRGIYIPETSSIKEITGKGMEVLLQDGIMVLCGSRQLLETNGIKIPAEESSIYGTEVFISFDGKYAGHIIINDTIKEDSKHAVSEMKKYGLWTAMLTGDAEENAKNVSLVTGIDEVFARQMPQDKLDNLTKIRSKHGAVMFIGDGINDAPVLAGADVGAAMGSGADAAIEAADVVFMNSNLGSVPESIKIAKMTKTVAMQNVIGALVIKAIVMVLGFAGIASMWIAVFADSGVAMLCVLNATRILFSKKYQENKQESGFTAVTETSGME